MASSHVPVRGDALAKTAGFCGWIWIFFALVGNLGEAGSHVSKLREVGVEYLLNVGGADWAYLVTIAAIPALLFALWGAKRAHRRLHAVAQERLLKQDGPFRQPETAATHNR